MTSLVLILTNRSLGFLSPLCLSLFPCPDPAPDKTIFLCQMGRNGKRKMSYHKQSDPYADFKMPPRDALHENPEAYVGQTTTHTTEESRQEQHEITKEQPEKLKDQEVLNRQRTKARRACFYCKEEGHYIRQCPLKRIHRGMKKTSKQANRDINKN